MRKTLSRERTPVITRLIFPSVRFAGVCRDCLGLLSREAESIAFCRDSKPFAISPHSATRVEARPGFFVVPCASGARGLNSTSCCLVRGAWRRLLIRLRCLSSANWKPPVGEIIADRLRKAGFSVLGSRPSTIMGAQSGSLRRIAATERVSLYAPMKS